MQKYDSETKTKIDLLEGQIQSNAMMNNSDKDQRISDNCTNVCESKCSKFLLMRPNMYCIMLRMLWHCAALLGFGTLDISKIQMQFAFE